MEQFLTDPPAEHRFRQGDAIVARMSWVLVLLIGLFACAAYLSVIHSVYVFRGATTEAAVTGAMRNAEAMIASLNSWGQAAALVHVHPSSSGAKLAALWDDEGYAPTADQIATLRSLVAQARTVEGSVAELSDASAVIVALMREFEVVNGTAHVGHAVRVMDELVGEAKRLLDALERGDLGLRIGR